MTELLTQAAYPTAPPVVPIKGTLLDIATDAGDVGWQDGRALYPSYNCITLGSTAQFCVDTAKTFDQAAGWVDGFRFAVYGGLKCRSVGLDLPEQKRQAERVFLAKESVGVERAFLTTRFVVGTTYSDGATQNWAAPTDLTPAGGAVSPAMGVGLLETHAATIYAGQPVLHMPRLVAVLMTQNGQVQLDGNVFRTSLGTPIAAGGGYDLPNKGPDGSTPVAGERWMYATGAVSVAKSDLISVQEVARANGTGFNANDVLLLVERAYIGTVDCYAAAVRVKVQ